MDKKLLSLVIIFILLFGGFSISILWENRLQRFTRAREFYKPSGKNSLIFAFPLEVKADGKDFSKITVFVRNEKGVPLSAKEVTLQTSLGVVSPTRVTTDKNGKAEFQLSSTQPGLANIKAIVDNIEIQKSVTIKFSE